MSVLCLCQLENHLQQSSNADDHIFPLESALAHHLQNMRRIAAAHLHVVARRDFGILRRVRIPVGRDHAFKAPLAAQNIGQQFAVLAGP